MKKKVLFIDNHREMASSGDVAVLNPVENPFDKIHKLFETTSQKIVEYDISEVNYNYEITITLEQRFRFLTILPPPPPLPILHQKKKPKKPKTPKKPKKLKAPERKNHHVVKNDTQIQQVQQVQYNQIAIPLPPLPTPPPNWHLTLYLMYFKKVQETVNDNIKNATDELSEENLMKLQALTEELSSFLEELGKFYHEENVADSTFPEHPQFLEILACTDRLQQTLDQLEESEIPKLLRSEPIKPTKVKESLDCNAVCTVSIYNLVHYFLFLCQNLMRLAYNFGAKIQKNVTSVS